MIHNYIAALPEISLAAGLLVMALVRLFRSENTPKTFYTLGKFFLAFTLLTTRCLLQQKLAAADF